MTEVNIEEARDAAVGALGSLAARRDRLPEERAELVAIAWHCGIRNVAALARIAKVSRDTIYADLRDRNIDPGDRDGPAAPRYRPLRREAVRQAADAVGGEVSGAMLAETPDPVVLAAWQAHIGLHRVADLTDTNPNDRENRLRNLRDLAARGNYVRKYANQALAEEFSAEQIVVATNDELMTAYGLDQVVVTGATLNVSLDEQQATVRVGSRGSAGPLAGWTEWASADATLPPVTAYRHLEVLAAFTTLADLLAEAEAASR